MDEKKKRKQYECLKLKYELLEYDRPFDDENAKLLRRGHFHSMDSISRYMNISHDSVVKIMKEKYSNVKRNSHFRHFKIVPLNTNDKIIVNFDDIE